MRCSNQGQHLLDPLDSFHRWEWMGCGVEVDPASSLYDTILGNAYHPVGYPAAENMFYSRDHSNACLSSANYKNPIVAREVEAYMANHKFRAVESDLLCYQMFRIRGSNRGLYRCKSIRSKGQSIGQVSLCNRTGLLRFWEVRL